MAVFVMNRLTQRRYRESRFFVAGFSCSAMVHLATVTLYFFPFPWHLIKKVVAFFLWQPGHHHAPQTCLRKAPRVESSAVDKLPFLSCGLHVLRDSVTTTRDSPHVTIRGGVRTRMKDSNCRWGPLGSALACALHWRMQPHLICDS